MEHIYKVNRSYKDRLFRFIFNDKKELLNLYNAINETAYDNPEDLEINTMDNVIYMGMKNDLSFLIYGILNLYEHQSTWNPNMPIRNLTESSKSPTSNAQSIKWRVGTYLYQMGYKPHLINCEAVIRL